MEQQLPTPEETKPTPENKRHSEHEANQAFLFNQGLKNSLIRQASDYKLYVNLGVLAGWATLAATDQLNPSLYILNILVPIFAVVTIVLCIAAPHFAFKHIRNLMMKGDAETFCSEMEVWLLTGANIMTVIVLILFLVSVGSGGGANIVN